MVLLSRSQIRGMFIGIAAGDALGMPNENLTAEQSRAKNGRVTRYIRPDGHKWFNGREAGTWTDDTQLTLLVADSLVANKGFSVPDLALRHVKYWKVEGDLGFGPTTREAIKKLDAGIHHSQSGISNNPKHGLGNAMPMKVAPLGAFRVSSVLNQLLYPDEHVNYRLRDFTIMTHYTNMAIQSAFAHVAAIRFCLEWNVKKGHLTDEFITTIIQACESALKIEERFKQKNLPLERFKTFRQIPFQVAIADDFIEKFGGGTSYVYNSLPFSYAFFLRDPFDIETLYDVVNAGGDTDTNGSIVGGMLGALNGEAIFPRHLIDGLWQRERILATADKFYDTFFVGNEKEEK